MTMYHGVQERKFNVYVDKSIESGWRFRNLHIYTCDKCRREAAVLLKAEEPFFCECQSLISLEAATTRSAAR